MKPFSLLFFYTIAIFLFPTCKAQKKKLITDNSTPDKMIELNKNAYEKYWKTIDSLENQGLPKSALEKVQELYSLVQEKEEPAQVIKCLIYLGKYQTQLEEDGFVKTLSDMKVHIDIAAFPQNKILESMLAEMYQRYLDQNYWKLRDRTELSDFKPDDMQTWTIGQLTEASRTYYLSSINDNRTQQVDLDDFEVILTRGHNSEGLQPTLYDFLVYRATNHFSNERNYLSKPAFQFYINQEEALGNIETYTNMVFESEDSTSYKLTMLKLFQELLKFHANDKSDEALLYANLRRLKFVYDNAVISGKEQIYLQTLKALETQYQAKPVSTEIAFRLAEFYFNEGQRYEQGQKNEKQFYWKTALELCEAAIEAYPESFGVRQCKNIRENILQKEMSFRTELVNLPNKPILLNVSYRNITKVFGRVIKVDEKIQDEIQQLQYDKIGPYLMRLDPLAGFGVDLPEVGDYRNHSTESKIDGLPLGRYLIVLSTDQKLDDKSTSLQYLFLHVSELAYSHRNDVNGKANFVVTHRQTGAPLQNVKIDLYEERYNSRRRRNEEIFLQSLRTDLNGFATYNGASDKYFKVVLTKGNDKLSLGTRASNVSRSYDRRVSEHIHFFLDRAIYRPGQSVYFKGILLRTDKKGMPGIRPNASVSLELRDVNNQVASTLELRTNEYGTLNGFFIAPNNGITGRMQIRANWDAGRVTKAFRVEEYKRPKFEVKMDPVKGSFKIDDEVTVTGQAKAYAGSNIDGAQVVYRVVREARYPYFPWWRWGWRPTSRPPVEIANGTTTTDASGKFSIDFKALGDPSIDEDKKPEFNYTVYTDVIDITGETHSATGRVLVGSVALKVSFDFAALVNADSLKKVSINTTNLNGEFEAATGNLKINKLQVPDKSFIDRYWAAPDQYSLSENDFKKSFPNIAYQGEDKEQNWPVGTTVFEQGFDTKNAKELIFDNTDFQPGKYVATLNTQDAFGKDIELKKYFTVYDLDSEKVPSNETYFHVMEQVTYEPGETAKWYFGASGPALKMLVEIEYDNEIVESKWLNVKGLESFVKGVEERHRGGLFYTIYFTKNNRFYNNAYRISVPWSNKQLSIEYSTFRDKLYPGQKETWSLKVSGPDKEKLAAEMVAGMYDASLDAFAPNSWTLSPYPYAYKRFSWRVNGANAVSGREVHYNWSNREFSNVYRNLRALNWFGFNYYEGYFGNREMAMDVEMDSAPVTSTMAEPKSARPPRAEGGRAENRILEASSVEEEAEMVDEVMVDVDGNAPGIPDEGSGDAPQIRTNLKETVFFFPDLKTDKDGNVIIEFTMNEALTRWKFMGLAHTKDLQIGITTNEIVTQKDLMVMPNPPRFFREGDEIEFTAKVSNLTEQTQKGTATLELFNALTMEPIDAQLGNTNNRVSFTAQAGQSDRLAWKLNIPVGYIGAVTHRVVAKADSFSDGEESALPVLTNRMLVTETKPLPVRGNQTKQFTFQAMEKASRSNTLTHHKMTLEFTSNPAWYAVQALPYLMEYPYECTEQIFSRYYANALASSVANAHPKVKRVFEAWKGTEALESNLSKNQELKTALLEETPWVLSAQSEEQQKKNIGLLFDLNRMANESQKALNTIADRQLGNGGFAWFPGGRDSWYITQYIVEGMGHLNELGVKELVNDQKTQRVIQRAVSYIDDRIVEHYDDLKRRIKRHGGNLEDDHLGNMAIHYLYARSFFRDIQIPSGTNEAYNYYLGQAEKYWLKKGMYSEGMLALSIQRFKPNSDIPGKIVKSLDERSLNNDELGMYWKYNSGYYWYQLPIETHALMIEVFDEVAGDEQAVDDLKVWLLKNKQTTHWKTTKATAAAVYALLRRGDNWLLEDQPVQITLGSKVIDQSKLQTEAGTGYFKTSWDGDEIENDMSQIKVENPNKVVAWGAMYWQYFEQLDKIETFEETPLTINKKLFKVDNSDTGPQMKLLAEGAQLSPGDKLHVRIELRVDRDMEYVHMKDMRASGFEPINVLSTYKWQAGLGYYESTRDAATNFFISYLPKGTYVFEYPMRVIHNGNFSNGITTIQCMYAPEFTSHSEGIRVTVQGE